ncbi:hypothetical protein PF008_g27373 [Phytophthora fragariae]|uniref:Secreted protein n=1 Tax=Phytophthora fragariae TaxID=53985 RepID=A0A6G0QEC7_9STRA|nr:hypothetical protein PF008_g27373 [Phytophthora fragariae]
MAVFAHCCAFFAHCCAFFSCFCRYYNTLRSGNVLSHESGKLIRPEQCVLLGHR